MILFLVSFLAGILSALAPCVLPLLPVIVGGSVASSSAQGYGRTRAVTIATSLGVSVILFTILLKVSTVFISVPQSTWQLISGIILILFGVVMIFPKLWDSLGLVNVLNRSSNKLLGVGYQKNSFWGDVVMGAALGPVFSSCSPTYFVVLATVLPVSFAMGFADLVAYALGLSGTLLLIALVGQRLVDKLGVTIEPGGWFRRTVGVLFLIVGIAVATGTMARAEAWLLNKGFGFAALEQRLLGAPAQTSIATSTALLSLEAKAGTFTKAPELRGIEGYINTPSTPSTNSGQASSGQAGPITIGQFKGDKVVLIDIWTYSCINCQRTLPYLKMWYDKYHDQGLEIIGVHTPEFAFEHVLANVQQAVQKFGLKYPVVLDNTYATWNAFGNQFWPRKYLIDIDGYIVYDHAGEGNYEETASAIERALAERAARLNLAMPGGDAGRIPNDITEVDISQLGSPEVYFGAARNEHLGDGVPGRTGEQTLKTPIDLRANTLYVGGTWNFSNEYARNAARGATITFVYKAKNVYFVAAAPGGSVKIKVTRDGGKPLGSAAGKDIDTRGEATILEDRLYHLVGDSDYGIHTIEIEVQGAGLEAYTFTFG